MYSSIEDPALTDYCWTEAQIQSEIARINDALRNDPSEHEKFVLQCQLRDYLQRIENPDSFELARRKFFQGEE